MKKPIIGFASDHAGFETKEFLIGYLENKGFKCVDYGCESTESCDYPDYAHKLANGIENNECNIGVSICGSGNGISMAMNKHQHIRAALCWNVEIAALARQHNDANVCSIPGRFVDFIEATNILDTFLNTEFEGGRHQRRIDKIPVK